MPRSAAAAPALFISPLAEATLTRGGQLRQQLGILAFEQFTRLVDDPTPETARTLNSIWAVTLFPPLLRALARDVPAARRDVDRCLVAIESLPPVLRVDNRAILAGREDTHAEQRGER